MKIIDKRVAKGVKFQDITDGECFFDFDGNAFYMKIRGNAGEKGRAVNLDYGDLVLFGLNEEVQPVQASITIS